MAAKALLGKPTIQLLNQGFTGLPKPWPWKPPAKGSRSMPFPLAILTLLRSEEHTSELQSRGHLVCRLLLEKKKLDNTLCHLIIVPKQSYTSKCPVTVSSKT